MKKVLATTMATLLFGLSFPVNTFALPDNDVSANSQVLEKVSLPNGGDGFQSEAGADNKAKEDTIAKKIEGKLEAKDITVWEEDKVNWKDGVKLKEEKEEFKNYLKDAVVTDLDNRNTSASSEKNWKGRLKVKFSDNSEVILNGQNLLVINKVTSADNANAPKDAIKTNFFLGEGVKVSLDKEEKIGNKEKPVPYRTYKVKPGTDVSEYKLLATKKNIFDTISAKPINENYTDVKWQPRDYKVKEDNKSFTATASKLFTMTFKFVGYDRDSRKGIDSDKLPQAIKDKLPQEQKIKEGEAFVPNKFEDTIKENSGENKYEWKFNNWNPTKSVSVSEDKNFEGTWTRSKLEENPNPEVKPGPGKEEDKKERPEKENKPKDNSKAEDKKEKPQEENKPKDNSREEDNKNNKKSNNTFPRIKSNENKSYSNKVYTRTSTKETKKESKTENLSKTPKYTLTINSGEYEVLINGQVIKRQMDVKPLIKNDRLMLPLRSLAEMIGAKVEWDPQTRTAIFTNKGIVAKIQIDGNEIVLSNGKVIKMDSKPLNINGRILLPISNVANVFGLTNGNTKDGIDQNIEWDGDNKTVEINLNK
ncbi:stalk domain-containing protein [Peptoniphilus harei]|uniref:stalk domain-containing protein n=1 Tax=Peptoniphilus harei TaxID=54005 RepID=UPI0025502244|nr:stalk domain-containing protein [Peptoniphilus harei]MDK7354611.1 stalk domain-containing protein [Peptoniphilus harei]MDK7370514.1 stalk domain-containing protein [Peptoniphilus harei]